MMKLADMTVTGFADTVASDAPAPGGGSCAALYGSIGAALTAMVGGWLGLLTAVILMILGPTIWVQILGHEKALFPYEYPALFSIAIAFIGIWVFSATDNSPEGMREREQFRAQFIRSQTGIGIERGQAH